MSRLAEDLNEKDHYLRLIYSLKHSLNLHIKTAQCQYLMEFIVLYLMYTSITLQEDDISENQTNIYAKKGTLSSKLTNG